MRFSQPSKFFGVTPIDKPDGIFLKMVDPQVIMGFNMFQYETDLMIWMIWGTPMT